MAHPLRLGFFVVSALLLLETIMALRAGRMTQAGICLGALATALVLMRDVGGAARRTATEAPARARPITIAAILYPDQADGLDELLATTNPSSDDVTVLVIEPTPEGAPALSREEALALSLCRATLRASRPITLMRATGADPAVIALEVAVRLQARRLCVLHADGSAAVQMQRCTDVWRRLPGPRASLEIALVTRREGESATFTLPASDAAVHDRA
jgi:hypothetical protein